MKTKIFVLLVMVFFLLSLTACSDTAADPQNVHKGEPGKVVDYGNNVYYFPYTSEYFGNSLSQFLTQHPELEVSGMSGNGTGGNGYDLGYFVCFRNKKQ